MTEEEFQKKVKSTKTFCIVIGVIFAIMFVVSIFAQSYLTSFTSLVCIILLYLFYSLTKKKKIAGPIIGIIIGSAYILQFNIVTIIIGVLVIVDCASLIKYINAINKSNNIWYIRSI